MKKLIIILLMSFFPITGLALDYTNMVSNWNFDESSGNADDNKGNNVLVNSNSTGYATGKINNGADLESGSSNSFYIEDANITGLDETDDFAASLWIKPESNGTNSTIFGKWNGTGDKRSYEIFLDANNQIKAYISSDGTNANTSKIQITNSALSNGTWYHIVVVYTATTGSITTYVNNSAHTTTGHKTNIYNSDSNFSVGGDLGEWGIFDGMIDEFSFWNSTLDSTAVAELYNSGAGLAYTPEEEEEETPTTTPQEADLVNSWIFAGILSVLIAGLFRPTSIDLK